MISNVPITAPRIRTPGMSCQLVSSAVRMNAAMPELCHVRPSAASDGPVAGKFAMGHSGESETKTRMNLTIGAPTCTARGGIVVEVTQRWQRAALMPSWIRWLPCAFAYLTVVPNDGPFRRSAWDPVVPWDEAAWCDPGDLDDWVARARQRRRWEQGDAEERARRHYEWILRVRAARIELFTEMCRRQSVPIPHTVSELLVCLAGFGLFDLDHSDSRDDPLIRPRLDRDPMTVLPLTEAERELEARAQRDDRAVLIAIALRRLAQRSRRRWRRRVVRTSASGLAAAAGVSAEQVRQGLRDLADVAALSVEGEEPGGLLRVTVPWPDFRVRFPFSELPAPEHAV